MQANVIGFAIRFRGIVLGLALVLLGYGVLLVVRAKYDVFPEFAPPQVGIQTEAPGLTPEQIEVLVTLMAFSIGCVPGVQSLRSTSIQGKCGDYRMLSGARALRSLALGATAYELSAASATRAKLPPTSDYPKRYLNGLATLQLQRPASVTDECWRKAVDDAGLFSIDGACYQNLRLAAWCWYIDGLRWFLEYLCHRAVKMARTCSWESVQNYPLPPFRHTRRVRAIRISLLPAEASRGGWERQVPSGFSPGSLVRARGRDWIVLPDQEPSVLRLRPLTAALADEIGVFIPLEGLQTTSAEFAPPRSEHPGDATGVRSSPKKQK